jgi:hypothetical protein
MTTPDYDHIWEIIRTDENLLRYGYQAADQLERLARKHDLPATPFHILTRGLSISLNSMISRYLRTATAYEIIDALVYHIADTIVESPAELTDHYIDYAATTLRQFVKSLHDPHDLLSINFADVHPN